jgi:hypothetical protein
MLFSSRRDMHDRWRRELIAVKEPARTRLHLQHVFNRDVSARMSGLISLRGTVHQFGTERLLVRLCELLADADGKPGRSRDHARLLAEQALLLLDDPELAEVAEDFGWDDLPRFDGHTMADDDEVEDLEDWWTTSEADDPVIDRAATIHAMGDRLARRVLHAQRVLSGELTGGPPANRRRATKGGRRRRGADRAKA